MGIFSKDTISALEAAIERDERQAERLAGRIAEAGGAVDQAIAKRRELEADDIADERSRAAADAEVRKIEGRRASLADARQYLQDRIEQQHQKLAEGRDAAARGAEAAQLEAAAKAAEVAVAKIVKAAAELDRARQDLATALAATPRAVSAYAPPTTPDTEHQVRYLAPTFFDDMGSCQSLPIDAAETAARIVGHVVAGSLPSLAIVRREDISGVGFGGKVVAMLGPVDATDARALLVDGIRDLAAQIRSGTARLAAAETAAPPMDPRTVPVPETTIHALRPLRWRDGSAWRTITAWVHSVPAPVADIALKKGLAALPGTPKAKAAGEARKPERMGSLVASFLVPVRTEDYVDIGFDLAAWRQTQAKHRLEAK